MNIEENYRKLRELEKLGDKYYSLLGSLVMGGMSIQNAIDECYKSLIQKNALDLLINEMKKPFNRKKLL